MWKLKLLIGVTFFAAIAVLGMVINAENGQIVSPKLLGIAFPQASLGIWLFVALLVGGILGYLVSLISALKSRGQHARLNRKLKHCEQELAQLRTSGLRD